MTMEANRIVEVMVSNAQAAGPKDPLTVIAQTANMILGLLLLPTLLIVPVFTLVLGFLVRISFGILLLPLSGIWIVFFAILMGTSWLWIKAWYFRPVLLVPGVLIARAADLYVSFVPDMGEKYQKVLKLALCDSWPYSFLVFQEARDFDSSYMI